MTKKEVRTRITKHTKQDKRKQSKRIDEEQDFEERNNFGLKKKMPKKQSDSHDYFMPYLVLVACNTSART